MLIYWLTEAFGTSGEAESPSEEDCRSMRPLHVGAAEHTMLSAKASIMMTRWHLRTWRMDCVADCSDKERDFVSSCSWTWVSSICSGHLEGKTEDQRSLSLSLHNPAHQIRKIDFFLNGNVLWKWSWGTIACTKWGVTQICIYAYKLALS